MMEWSENSSFSIGYAWRRGHSSAALNVWYHMDAVDRKERDIETVEAEVVYLIRAAGQWPAFQTESIFIRPHQGIARPPQRS